MIQRETAPNQTSRTTTVRRLLGAAALLGASSLTLLAGTPASAASGEQHDGDRSGVEYMGRVGSQEHEAQAASTALQYSGGVDGIAVTTRTPRVYLVLWGSQWGSAS